MRFLIFSDVHGNLPAFEKMLAAEKGIDLYISLGDVVNYGPWSNECVDLLESLPSIKLLGNHEEYFLNGCYPGESELVQLFFKICSDDFTRKDRIEKYGLFYDIGSYRCQHTIMGSYIFPSTVIEVIGNYFIGHSHYQFKRKTDEYEVVNVGSVGQNRSEINVINYAIYNVDNNAIDLKSQIYDIDLIVSKMKSLQYPLDCVNYYLDKQQRVLN
jgi:hypothetical protein